ncbi:IclR family transcriptional regulator [Mycolicibacterium sp. D5.8-2]|uniref:IclR family transcriptional regulator n=1 Tax=Mycolicibacterium sp. D5.8-2 TaxID=3085903 RepID=UPI00399B876C
MRVTNRAVPSPSVLSRAFTLLRCFQEDETRVGVTELAQRAALPKATTHRMLQEMIKLGIVERNGTGYQIGISLFELGQLASKTHTLRDAAFPQLARLREMTGATVHLVVPDGTDVVYLEKLVGPRGPKILTRIGGRMPAYCTGLGKAVLAHSSAHTVRTALEAELRRRTPRTITMPGILNRELDAVRKTGVAYEFEESAVGVVCTAAPILDAQHVAVAAISASGRGNLLDPRRVAPAVREAADSISGSLSDFLSR